MVCAQIMGNDTTISFASSNRHFEWNVFKPFIICALSDSATLIVYACKSFIDYCVIGIEPNLERIDENLQDSLMLVTALNPHIDYEKVAKIAKSLC